MDCQELRVQIFTYMDGELSVAEMREVTVHIDSCQPCAYVVAYEVRIREVVQRGCCEKAPATMRDRVLGVLDEA